MRFKDSEFENQEETIKYLRKVQLEIVQEKLRVEESIREFYKVLVKYNLKDAKNVVVSEDEMENDVALANKHLKNAENALANYEKEYQIYCNYACDEYNFYKIERKELRKDVSEMHALLKKFTKKSRHFTVEKGEAEDNDQPSA